MHTRYWFKVKEYVIYVAFSFTLTMQFLLNFVIHELVWKNFLSWTIHKRHDPNFPIVITLVSYTLETSPPPFSFELPLSSNTVPMSGSVTLKSCALSNQSDF